MRDTCGYCSDLFNAISWNSTQDIALFWKNCPVYDSVWACDSDMVITIKNYEAVGIFKGKKYYLITPNETTATAFYIDKNKDTIYYELKNPADFNGTVDELRKFLKKEVTSSILMNNITEQPRLKIWVAFIVDEKGDIINPHCREIHGYYHIYDQEAVRIIKAMPKWTTAKYKGRTVKYEYVFPIIFSPSAYDRY